MYVLGILSLIFALFLGVSWYSRYSEKKSAKNKRDEIVKAEKWGEYLPPSTEIQWGMARRENWHTDAFPDSRGLLESFGFKILGITDEMTYLVEPPAGWMQEYVNEFNTYLLDESGKRRLHYFRKNDIMNLTDYRSYVSAKIHE
jgi:hypothetical protein